MDTEEQVAAILADWSERQQSGDHVDPEDVIRSHPELTALLRDGFAALEYVDAAVGRVSASPPAPAKIGPYRIRRQLGVGGMGTVYLGETDEAEVAVKVIHPHLLQTPGYFKRFLREAELGREVEHANVVRTLDVDAIQQDGRHFHYLVMEYVEGQTLRELLHALDRVPEELCRHIGSAIARALVAIHAAGAIHRDLKPENVLITKDQVVKVMDLGVAQLADEAMRLSLTGAFVGSVLYAAPEQFAGGGADARADLYALGLLLYELATGRHPFQADDVATVMQHQAKSEPRRIAELNPQLSPFFEEVVHTLLRKDREQRFGSAGDLVEIFEQAEHSNWWKDQARRIRATTKQPLRRIRIPRETALCGRDAQLAQLRSWFDQAKAGNGRVVLVEGEAGIGKTRIVDEFVGQLRQEGEDINFLFGSYPPGGAATASGAFSTAYREHLGDLGAADYLNEVPLLVPAFAALLNGEPPPTGSEPLTKDSLQTVFVHATRSLAKQRTTVVLIDDLHFAPEEGRALFMSLALAVLEHRILLIGSSRPGLPDPYTTSLDRLDQSARLPLARLGPKDLVHLLKDAFQSEHLAHELGAKIGEKSDGNPFFVFEIIRGLKEGQFLARGSDGSWHTTRVIRDIQVPSSITDLVQARIADLDDNARNLLEVASCCGFEFDPTLVADGLGGALIPTLQSFGRVETRHRLVRSAGRSYVFDHHQVQESLYGGLHDRLREQYHAALGEALEARAGETSDGATAVQLAEHFLRGARGERALPHLDAALDRLEEGYLNDQALRLLNSALDVPGLLSGAKRVELLLRKAGRLNLLGRRDEERAALEEALALADEIGDPVPRAEVRRSLGSLLMVISQSEAAEATLQEARELARAAGDWKLEGQATGILGRVLKDLGRYVEAREHLERARAVSREVGDRRGEASATGNLGGVLWLIGRYAEAQEHYERWRALCREIGDRRGEAAATSSLGNVFCDLGRYAEAQEHYERGRAIAREIGYRQGEAITTGNLGNVFIHLGRVAEAQEHYERHGALSREIGFPQGEVIATGNLGSVFKDLGRYAEARKQLERSCALSREIGSRKSEVVATDNLGSLQASLGDTEAARRTLEESLAIAREIGSRRHEGYVLHSLGDVAYQKGDLERARGFFGEALALRRELGEKGTVAETLVALGRLAAARSETESAATLLDEALALAQETKSPDTILAATVERARLPDGDVEAALRALEEYEERVPHEQKMDARFRLWELTQDKVHLAEAHRLLAFMRDHAPEEDRDSMIENVPLHRDIMKAWEEHASGSTA